MSLMTISKKRSGYKSRVAKKSVKPKKINKTIRHSKLDQHTTKIISSRIRAFFNDANLNEIARSTGYLIRQSPITPFIFLYALSMGLFGTIASLDLLAMNIGELFKIDLTGSAFSARMSENKSVTFLKTCFEKFLAVQLESTYKNGFCESFSMFKAVILEDSTGFELNGKVAKGLKGSGGAASKSSVKLNFVFNICTYAAMAVDIFSGNTPDRKNSKKSLKHIKKGMLVLRDLGYFVVSNLRTINEKKAFYLSRVPKGSLLYLKKDDKTPQDIGVFFKQITRGGQSVKMPIFIGKEERFLTYIVLQKVPNWVLKQRIRQYKKKNSGATPSNAFVSWAKYSVFITNIPDELLNENDSTSIKTLIMEIYKIRWQIELLFKKFKSKIKLASIDAKNKNRVLCAIYGRLISILLSLMVLSYAASKNYKGREISLWKVTSWLVSQSRLAKAILNGELEVLYFNCCKHFKLLCKDKRNRSTALQRIESAFSEKILSL